MSFSLQSETMNQRDSERGHVGSQGQTVKPWDVSVVPQHLGISECHMPRAGYELRTEQDVLGAVCVS